MPTPRLRRESGGGRWASLRSGHPLTFQLHTCSPPAPPGPAVPGRAASFSRAEDRCRVPGAVPTQPHRQRGAARTASPVPTSRGRERRESPANRRTAERRALLRGPPGRRRLPPTSAEGRPQPAGAHPAGAPRAQRPPPAAYSSPRSAQGPGEAAHLSWVFIILGCLRLGSGPLGSAPPPSSAAALRLTPTALRAPPPSPRAFGHAPPEGHAPYRARRAGREDPPPQTKAARAPAAHACCASPLSPAPRGGWAAGTRRRFQHPWV